MPDNEHPGITQQRYVDLRNDQRETAIKNATNAGKKVSPGQEASSIFPTLNKRDQDSVSESLADLRKPKTENE